MVKTLIEKELERRGIKDQFTIKGRITGFFEQQKQRRQRIETGRRQKKLKTLSKLRKERQSLQLDIDIIKEKKKLSRTKDSLFNPFGIRKR